MRSLTLWPEWLWAFTALDKRLENRTWCPPAWLTNRYFCLHAGGRIHGGASVFTGLENMALMALDAGWRYIIEPSPVQRRKYTLICGKIGFEQQTLSTDTMIKSAIVAVVRLIDVKYNKDLPWAIPGQHHWILDDTIHVLEHPVPCKGHLGLWKLDQTQIKQVLDQVSLP